MSTENELTQEMQPISAPAEQMDAGLGRAGVIVGATAAGALLLGGLVWNANNDGSQAIQTDGTELDADAGSGVSPADVDNAPEMNDQLLFDGNYLCGGNADPNGVGLEDFSYKNTFFNASPENESLAKSMAHTHITDTVWGMGQAAFNVWMNSDMRLGNNVTRTSIEELPEEDRTTSSPEMDWIIDGTFSVALKEDVTFVNGDCRNVEGQVSMPSPDVPVIKLKKDSTVEVLPLTNDLYLEMRAAAEAEGDNGFDTFLFIEAKVPMRDENGELVYVDGMHMVLAANGCDNTVRLLKTPETPGESTTTIATPPTSSVPGRKATPPTTIDPTAPNGTSPQNPNTGNPTVGGPNDSTGVTDAAPVAPSDVTPTGDQSPTVIDSVPQGPNSDATGVDTNGDGEPDTAVVYPDDPQDDDEAQPVPEEEIDDLEEDSETVDGSQDGDQDADDDATWIDNSGR